MQQQTAGIKIHHDESLSTSPTKTVLCGGLLGFSFVSSKYPHSCGTKTPSKKPYSSFLQ
jgi:hypothetical protein